MTDTPDIQTKWRRHAKASLTAIPNSRSYALDDAALDALAALAFEWQNERAQRELPFEPAELTKLFVELAAQVPGMVQKKPGDAPPTPKPWPDPVSGLPAQNPYAADPPDVASITLLEQADPALAEHLKRTAKGTSYVFLHELRQAEAKRARLANIRYGAAEHERNPFRLGIDGVREQSLLMTKDRELALVFQAEAEPVRLPWQSDSRDLTVQARISARDPSLGALVRQAESLLESWTRDELAAARSAEASAREHRIAAEMRLGVPAK